MTADRLQMSRDMDDSPGHVEASGGCPQSPLGAAVRYRRGRRVRDQPGAPAPPHAARPSPRSTRRRVHDDASSLDGICVVSDRGAPTHPRSPLSAQRSASSEPYAMWSMARSANGTRRTQSSSDRASTHIPTSAGRVGDAHLVGHLRRRRSWCGSWRRGCLHPVTPPRAMTSDLPDWRRLPDGWADAVL